MKQRAMARRWMGSCGHRQFACLNRERVPADGQGSTRQCATLETQSPIMLLVCPAHARKVVRDLRTRTGGGAVAQTSQK